MATVLAIDDDPDILVVIAGALESAGHVVVTETVAQDVVTMSLDHGVDVVVLDVNMPDFSGFDALAALRDDARTGGLPVLFLSALGDSHHRIRGLRRGADDYLGKPFEPEELVLRVEKLQTKMLRAGSIDSTPAQSLREALLHGDLTTGQVFLGRYQVLEKVGKGATGVVLRGWDARLRRPVALKVFLRTGPLEGVAELDLLAALTEEAAILARFSHPNIVSVYDAGVDRGVGFIVMEFVTGVSLLTRLRDQVLLPRREVVRLGIEVCRALQTAHDQQLVHRDITPSNILLGSAGEAKVTDFGVAGIVTSLSREDVGIIGTPGYVPPEALRGEVHGAAGDIFSLGAVLYFCLTGRLAYCAPNGSLRDLLRGTLEGELVAIEELRPGTSPELCELVLRMLSRQPEQRPLPWETEKRLRALVP
ncbi:MAG: protein kinase [Acidobacteriota bacterium]